MKHSFDLKQPMLACRELPDLAKLTYPLFVSPKLDGIRCIIKDGVAYSRKLLPIPNLHIQDWAKKNREQLGGFDGELIVGSPTAPDCYKTTQSAVMSVNGKPDFTYYVFDMWNVAAPFDERLDELWHRVSPHRACELVVQHVANEPVDVEELEVDFVNQGYEGVMLRSMNGQYKQGRSTMREQKLLKLKRFEDDEAVIVGYKPKYLNLNEAKIDETGHTKRGHNKAGKVATDMLGAFTVVNKHNQEFDVGTGYSDEDRKSYWQRADSLIGSIIVYKHQPHGADEAPRFPVFKGFRTQEDL